MTMVPRVVMKLRSEEHVHGRVMMPGIELVMVIAMNCDNYWNGGWADNMHGNRDVA